MLSGQRTGANPFVGGATAREPSSATQHRVALGSRPRTRCTQATRCVRSIAHDGRARSLRRWSRSWSKEGTVRRCRALPCPNATAGLSAGVRCRGNTTSPTGPSGSAFRSRLSEQVDEVGATFSPRHHERSGAQVVCDVRIGAPAQQVGYRFDVPEGDRPGKGRATEVGAAVDAVPCSSWDGSRASCRPIVP